MKNKKEDKNKDEELILPSPTPLDIVEFDEESHTYTNVRKQQVYISATTLIGKYKQPFDDKSTALEVTQNPKSKYWGMDPTKLAKEWEMGGKQAAEDGTTFHKKKEDKDIKSGQQFLTGQQRKIIAYKEGKKRSLESYEGLEDGIHLEFLVLSHIHLISGLIDKLVIDGDYFDIYDYKTNKNLYPIKKGKYYTCNSYYSVEKYGGYKKMKYPLNKLNDCYIVHYTLQLSLYAYLLEQMTGKKARNLIILHHPNTDGIIEERETPYSLPYMKKEVMLMLEMWGGFAPKDFVPTNQQKHKE